MECQICKKEVKNLRCLSSHLRIHKTLVKDYYDKFLKKENEDICLECGKDQKRQEDGWRFLRYRDYIPSLEELIEDIRKTSDG